MRKFEVAIPFNKEDVRLPKRGTEESAGYDFFALKDVTVPSIWSLSHQYYSNNPSVEALPKITMIETGVKADMPSGEFLDLRNRSSNPKKKGLVLANGAGVVDKDYYGNTDNDGHIMFPYINFGFEDVVIKKGESIGQGIFIPFKLTEDDQATGPRMGGFGSTGSK